MLCAKNQPLQNWSSCYLVRTENKKRGQPISRLPSIVVQKRPSGHTGKVILRL